MTLLLLLWWRHKLEFSRLKQLAEGGNANAQFELARKLDFTNKNLPEAAYWYRKAGDQGHLGALLQLGILYEFGHPGYSSNETRAWEAYHHAAKLGSAEARRILGRKALDEGDLTKAYMFFSLGLLETESARTAIRRGEIHPISWDHAYALSGLAGGFELEREKLTEISQRISKEEEALAKRMAQDWIRLNEV